MLENGSQQVPDIPFEVVDDEEMAAIERAFLHAQSLASRNHSLRTSQVLVGTDFGHFIGGRSSLFSSNPSNLSSPGSQKQQTFVYTQKGSFSEGEGLYGGVGTRARASSGYYYCPSQRSMDIVDSAHHDSADLGDSSTVNSTPDEFSSGAVDAHGILLLSTDPADQSLVGSQVLTPVLTDITRVTENVGDIEDTGDSVALELNRRDMISERVSLLLRHRRRRGLSVTDFTSSDWCEKQVEFSMTRGKPAKTVAMKIGSERHLQLEVEVVTRVEIEIQTKEDAWATRLLNFISGSRQLLSEGLTRELPVLGLVAGTWIVGIIDEIRLVEKDGQEYPLLLDTKTRRRRMPPSEPQKRNARLQLMSYKYLWDSMVENGFPYDSFFQHFELRPHQKLCSDVRVHASGFYQEGDIRCLQDLLPLITSEIVNYPRSVDSLLLRYEWQTDQSLLGQDEFDYDHDWLMDKWTWHLDFWKGRRQAAYVSEDESWKCRYCSFASVCKPDQFSSEEILAS